MKIVEASVAIGERGYYVARVVIEDDGRQYEGRCSNTVPDRALNAAFSDAARARTDELRGALRVDLRVVF